MITYKQEVYFGTANGDIRHVSRDYMNDVGEAIEAYWESGSMDFDAPFKRKYSKGLWLGIKPEANGEINVTAITDRTSNLDEETSASDNTETSASGFFTHAIAWGVNNGLLDAKIYKPIAQKAWEGLLTRVKKNGMVGYVQPVGAAPDAFTSDSTHAYGIGVFLLAGSQIAKMNGAKQLRSNAEILAEAQKLYDIKSVRTYAHREPRRKDDLAFENSKMAFRIYGPALKDSIENSGIDVWTKSVPYSVIDKWYDEDLAGIRSYHKDNGEGLDAFKVADTVGLGGTGIFKNGKLYKSNVYQVADIFWTTPQTAKFLVYYFYDVDGEKYTEFKEFKLDKDSDFCEVKSRFIKGNKKISSWNRDNYIKKNVVENIEVATGILPQSKDAQVEFNKENKSISVVGNLEKKSFDMNLILDKNSDLIEFKKLSSGEVVAIIKPKQGEISYKFGYKWGARK